MTQHIHVQEQLGDYVDDLLSARERDVVLEHLAACGRCQDEVETLIALRAEARALPREIAPPRDLWSGIAARLEPRAAIAAPEPEPRVIHVDFARRTPVWRRWSALAAAAVVLVVVSSAATALLLRTPAGTQTAALPPESQVGGTGPGAARPTTALVAWQPVENEYLSSVEVLQTELEVRRDQLSPETVAVIEQNLLIIDQAIADARAALEADPGSADLPLHLADVYRQKVQLLQTAVQLPGART